MACYLPNRPVVAEEEGNRAAGFKSGHGRFRDMQW